MSARRTLASALVALAVGPGLAGCVVSTAWQGARFYQSGTAALDAGNADGAIHDLERAAALVPDGSEVQNHLGLAYAAAGRDDDALRAFRRAVELDCDNGPAQANLRAAESRGSP